MTKEVMERRASDNVYLHKDFHGALSTGIEYLHTRYGEEAVREYLHQFTIAYYAPLVTSLVEEGLSALREHFENIYGIEGGKIETSLSVDELLIYVLSNPAVEHMRQHGYTIARLYRETIESVNKALCLGTPYTFELVEYDDATGRNTQRFFRRRS
ncbi:hypothetical protein LLG96_09080 [bacterium]|nr:hypothetical protein [bacterium]